MLVRARMTAEVITATPETTLGEALRITREKNIRHLPILDQGKLVGIVTDRDLRLAAPPVWASSTDYDQLRKTFESKTVADVMTSSTIISTTEVTPIEDAARVLYQNRIGCVPVMRDDQLVGILTETDVMRAFVELFRSDDESSRVEVRIPDKPGELARIVRAIGIDFKVNITGMVVPPIESGENVAILRLQTPDASDVVDHLRKIGYDVGSPALDLEPEDANKRERIRIQHWGSDGATFLKR